MNGLRPRALVTAALLLALALPSSPSVAASAPASDDSVRTAAWHADLDTLVTTLRRVHWHYRHAPFPRAFETQRAAIETHIESWGDARVVVEMQRMLATLDDGHTLIYPFGMRRGHLAHLPIAFYDFDDGLAIIAADSAHAGLVGRHVVSIGGVPGAGVLERLSDVASAENASQCRWVLPVYATFPDYLRAVGVPAPDDGVELVLEDPDSTGQVVVEVPARTGEIDPGTIVTGLVPSPGVAPPLALSRPDDAYWFTSLEDGVVYVQMNRVTSTDAEPLDAFAARLLERLDDSETSRLVIDLRYNSGGNAALLPPFVRTIVAFRVRRPDAAICVLIGRQTFSAAQTLVNRLEEYVSPVFVGEPTGSKPNRFGNEHPFELPHSGVVGGISSGYNQGATSRDTRSTTPPHVAVALTLADWRAGRDPALAAAVSGPAP
jgi:hypothetical protein